MNNQISLSDAQRRLLSSWLEQKIEAASSGPPCINLQRINNLQHSGVGITTTYDVGMPELVDHLSHGGCGVVIYPGNELFRVMVIDHPVTGLTARFSGVESTETLSL